MTDEHEPAPADDAPSSDTTPAAAAERAVLGAMLLSPAAVDDVTGLLASHQYASPRHELIHDAITHLHNHGRPVDAITVADHLGPDLGRAGGLSYLLDCSNHAPIPAAAARYAQIVRDAWSLRTVDAAVTRVHQAVTEATPHHDVLEIINAAREELDQLATSDNHTPSNEDAVQSALESLESPPGIPTPWDYLTNITAGWKPECLYLVGARPAVGKSVIANGIALDVARRGPAALIYSLEMSSDELYLRMFAAVGSIDMSRIQHRKLNDTDWQRLAEASSHVQRLPLHVDDRSALSLAQIRASIKAEQRKREVGIVIIDYLQLITPPRGTGREDRRVQVDSISRGLKALAKDTGLPIVALTQLNRNSEARADKTPTLADLREAGGQEQDADVVLLLHRDIHGHNDPPTQLKVIVAKNRHGSTGDLELLFRGEHSRAENAPWSPSAHLTKDAS